MSNPLKIVREKALVCGFGELSNEELMMLIIDDESPDKARALLSRMEGLEGLCKADIKQLRQNEELGVRGAVRVGACVELGRRAMALQSEHIEFVGSSDDIIRMFSHLGGLGHEEFWVVYLNSAGRVLERLRISQGGVSHAQVDCRIICKRAIELLATSVVLVHNHPSGVAEASRDDVALTEKIRSALALFDIRVVDHVIITANSSLSFVSSGLL